MKLSELFKLLRTGKKVAGGNDPEVRIYGVTEGDEETPAEEYVLQPTKVVVCRDVLEIVVE